MHSANRLQGYFTESAAGQAACQMVDHHPLASTFGMFGVGLGLGVAVGLLIAEYTAPESIRPLSFTEKTWDALAQVLPDSVMQTIRR